MEVSPTSVKAVTGVSAVDTTAAASSSDSGDGTYAVKGYVQNPPFDARLGQRGAVDSDGHFVTLPREQVQRGFIMTDKPQSDGKKYLVHFQFNPTSFAHSATLSGSVPTAGSPEEDTDASEGWMAFLSNTGQAISFSLLFDRTYETWQSDGQSFAGTQGVLADIKTLYALLGMYGTTKDKDSPDTNASVDPSALQQITPLSVLTGGGGVWVNFGSTLLSFYGIVNSVSVTYTHFTQKMVPVRAAVDITLAVIPKKEVINGKYGDSVPNAMYNLTWTNNPDPVNSINYISQRTQRVDQMLGKAAVIG